MSNCMMRDKDKKDTTITVRVTEKEKEQLDRRASVYHESLSTYMVNCAMAGLERRSKREKNRTEKLAILSQDLNIIYGYLDDENRDLSRNYLKAKIEIIAKDVQGLWES